MLKFLVQSNVNNTEVDFESAELNILLDAMEHQRKTCSKNEKDDIETLYNKIKALCIFDKLPDEQSIEQIKSILLSTENVTKDNIINLKIEQLHFSKKTFNCLNRANVKTVGELLCYSQEDLLKIRNLGVQSLNEIIDILEEHDLELPRYKGK